MECNLLKIKRFSASLIGIGQKRRTTMTDPKDYVPPVYDFGNDAGKGWPELDDQDYACILLPNFDYDAQLNAIRCLLLRQREDASSQRHLIAEIEAQALQISGPQNERTIDEWLDELHFSTYQNAAHSMAAVGMLAPFIEFIFHQAFLNIPKYCPIASVNLPSHPRWQQANMDKWDCHFVWENSRRRRDLVEGILQLADDVGLQSRLPGDLRQMLKALYGYRNKMFHHGFEWPMDERHNFAKCKEDWPDDWFSVSTSDGKPWIFYMSDTFIDKWILVTQQIIKSIVGYALDLENGVAQQAEATDRALRGR